MKSRIVMILVAVFALVAGPQQANAAKASARKSADLNEKTSIIDLLRSNDVTDVTVKNRRELAEKAGIKFFAKKRVSKNKYELAEVSYTGKDWQNIQLLTLDRATFVAALKGTDEEIADRVALEEPIAPAITEPTPAPVAEPAAELPVAEIKAIAPVAPEIPAIIAEDKAESRAAIAEEFISPKAVLAQAPAAAQAEPAPLPVKEPEPTPAPIIITETPKVPEAAPEATRPVPATPAPTKVAVDEIAKDEIRPESGINPIWLWLGSVLLLCVLGIALTGKPGKKLYVLALALISRLRKKTQKKAPPQPQNKVASAPQAPRTPPKSVPPQQSKPASEPGKKKESVRIAQLRQQSIKTAIEDMDVRALLNLKSAFTPEDVDLVRDLAKDHPEGERILHSLQLA